MVKFSDEDYVDSEIEPLQGEEEEQLVDYEPQQIKNQVGFDNQFPILHFRKLESS